MQQTTIAIPSLKVVQTSYDFHNERFLCRCQARPFTNAAYDEYVPLDELRTYCAQHSEITNHVDEGVTLQEWMLLMKPAGINATMTAVLNNRFQS